MLRDCEHGLSAAGRNAGRFTLQSPRHDAPERDRCMANAARAGVARVDVPELAARIAARADAADRAGRLPPEDVADLRAGGYLALSVPREYGGQGATLRECALAQLELAGASGSTAMVAAMPLHIFGAQREHSSWSAEHFAQLCRLTSEGALLNSVASEPQLGSPSRGAIFRSNARRVDGGWLVNGHKNWSTGGRHLTHLLVSLDIEGDPAQLLVPNDAPGIHWEPTWRDALSLRASDSDDVYLRDVCVPADHLLARFQNAAGRNRPNPWFPLLTAATYLGVALAARDAAIRFALERVPTALGKPVAALPGIQRQVGEMDVELRAARLMLLEAAHTWDEERDMAGVVPAKLFANDVAIRTTDRAMRVVGGQAITRALPLERCYRDVRGGLTHPPSGDLALERIGRDAIEGLAGQSA